MFYYFCRLIGFPFIYILFFPKIIGRKNRKLKGKGIVMSNHKSMWDPLFVTVLNRCQIHWMGKTELFQNRFVRWVFLTGGVFPVHRGETDVVAIRHAFKLLRDNKILGLFPEGTRSKGESIANFEPGTSMIALKNDATILPVYIKGDYRLFHRMTIIIGEQIRLSDYIEAKSGPKAVAAATTLLEKKLAELRDSNE